MNFKTYDILSALVPGFIIYSLILNFLDIPFEQNFIVPATAYSFIIGYFVNAISSWLEDFYYWTWGGKPSNKLIEGKGIWKVKFYEFDKVKKLLTEESGREEPSSDELFGIAFRFANAEKNPRVEDFNCSYAFSRVLLTTTIISSIILLINYSCCILLYPFLASFIFIAWLRCKQRAYYFSKEVLNTYLSIKRKDGK